MINNLNQSSPVETNQILNETQAANPNRKSARDSSKSSSSSSGNSNESFDQQLQQQGAIANAQANAPAQASQVNLSKVGIALGTAGQPSAQAAAKENVAFAQPKVAVGAHMNIAEYSPGTAKSATGMNAGASIAGLRPWNQDWVFEGNERPIREGEEIRPLIGGSQAEELAQVQAVLKQLNAMAGAPQANGLRSRGDQGLEKAGTDADVLAGVNARIASQLPQQLGGGVSSANLEQAISQMNGEVLGQPRSQLQNGMADKLSDKAKVANNAGAVPGLGGSEFLNTLTLVRGKNGAEASGEEQTETGENPTGFKLGSNMSGDTFGTNGKKSLTDLESGGESSLSAPYVLHSANLQPSQQGLSSVNAPVVVTGHVVPGAGVQDQLSHEAVANVATGIRNLGSTGGEMKIHLRPEGLGELHVKVTTQGQQVGLQIQASDENAKKILQDSMSTLKESLASQNLSLAKVDVSIAHAFSGGDATHSQHQQQHQQHQSGQPLFMNSDSRDMLGQNAGQQNQGSARWNEGSNGDGLTARPLRGVAAASARSAMAAAGAGSGSARMDGRLDVLA
jgi:flagellar hook-length control protein FliK